MCRKKYVFSYPVIILAAAAALFCAIASISCRGASSGEAAGKEAVVTVSIIETTDISIASSKNSSSGPKVNNKNKTLEPYCESNAATPKTAQPVDNLTAGTSLSAEEIIKTINEMLRQQVPPYNALLFLDKNIYLLEKKDACKAIDSVENLLQIYERKYSEMLSSDEGQDFQKQLNDFAAGYYKINNGEISREQAANIWDEELSSLLDEIFESGFKLVNLEGTWAAVIDYSRLGSYFGIKNPYV